MYFLDLKLKYLTAARRERDIVIAWCLEHFEYKQSRDENKSFLTTKYILSIMPSVYSWCLDANHGLEFVVDRFERSVVNLLCSKPGKMTRVAASRADNLALPA